MDHMITIIEFSFNLSKDNIVKVEKSRYMTFKSTKLLTINDGNIGR